MPPKSFFENMITEIASTGIQVTDIKFRWNFIKSNHVYSR
jgi:hypothetical protein